MTYLFLTIGTMREKTVFNVVFGINLAYLIKFQNKM